jgi:hypothetical protein
MSWKGKSERKPGKPGEPDTPANLQEAFENAWTAAKNAGQPAGTYVLKEIIIDTENPIRGYTVIIDHS